MDLPISYKFFDVPDQFVVGYGLDYRQKYRNLPTSAFSSRDLSRIENSDT